MEYQPWGFRNRVTLADVPTWPVYYAQKNLVGKQAGSLLPVNQQVNNKISMWRGDITRLEVDAIVNAANTDLWAGGGVCKSIHDAAGPELEKECERIGKCPEGQAVITGGYDLQAKYVIHAVGPTGERAPLLRSAYGNSFRLMKDRGLRTIAFPCISTGIFGYPNQSAARVALAQARAFLDEHHASVDRVIFVTYLHEDELIYEELMPRYFPVQVSQDGNGVANAQTSGGGGDKSATLRLFSCPPS